MGIGMSRQTQVTAAVDAGALPASPKQAPRPTADASPDPDMAPILPYSEPVAIAIPHLKLASGLISVGKAADGTMEVPQHPHFDKPAWYRHSPAPGQFGASVVVGHVDSYANSDGTSVFYGLSKLKPGSTIVVRRADGMNVTFTVQAVRDYDKHTLPTDIIYGPVTDGAELRLITCSGQFDQKTHTYDRNLVIFATMAKGQVT